MKGIFRIMVAAALVCLFAVCSCSGRRLAVAEVEFPFFKSARYDFSDITRIELSDTATIVTIRSEFIPNFTIDCGEDWLLRCSGQEYRARGGVGMSLGGSIVYGNDGVAGFSVIFDALPRKARSFDLISDNGAFDFFGVDLTGKACEKQDRRINAQEDIEGLPPFDESFAESSINIHLLNRSPESLSTVTVGLMQALGYKDVDVTADENGDATARFFLLGTSAYQVCFAGSQIGVEGVVNPGEDVEIFIDMNVFGHNIMRHRDGYRDPGVRYVSTSDRRTQAAGLIMSDEGFRNVFGISEEFEVRAARCMKERADSLERAIDDEYRTVEQWPGAGEWLEGLADAHKGKVAVIDFWNTWCLPCRSAMDSMEALKTGALESDDIVWIYLADDSSPIEEYAQMLGKYRGIHYRLAKNQRQEVYDYLGIDGIPYYLMVDRDGQMSKHPDFRDHALMVRTLLEKI